MKQDYTTLRLHHALKIVKLQKKLSQLIALLIYLGIYSTPPAPLESLVGKNQTSEMDRMSKSVQLSRVQAETDNHRVRPEFSLTGIKYDFPFHRVTGEVGSKGIFCIGNRSQGCFHSGGGLPLNNHSSLTFPTLQH